MILTINGKEVEVDDSFKDLSPEEQESQVQEIAGHMDAGHSSHETVKPPAPVDESSGLENLGGAIGAVAGTGIGGTAMAGSKLMNAFGPPSLQKYANSQIGDRYNVPLSDLEKEVGFKLQTMPEVQAAVRKVSKSDAMPETIKPVYGMDKAGQPVITHYEKIPGAAASEGIDLSKYKKGSLHGAKKFGAVVGSGALAGHDIGRGLADPTSIGGVADIGAGISAAAAPWLPKKVGKIPVRAIATGLGLAPVAKSTVDALMPEKAQGGLIHMAAGGQTQEIPPDEFYKWSAAQGQKGGSYQDWKKQNSPKYSQEAPSDDYYAWTQSQIANNAPVMPYQQWKSGSSPSYDQIMAAKKAKEDAEFNQYVGSGQHSREAGALNIPNQRAQSQTSYDQHMAAKKAREEAEFEQELRNRGSQRAPSQPTPNFFDALSTGIQQGQQQFVNTPQSQEFFASQKQKREMGEAINGGFNEAVRKINANQNLTNFVNRGYAEGGLIDMLMGHKPKAQKKAKGGKVSGSHEDALKKILSKK